MQPHLNVDFAYRDASYRFNLNKRAGKPRGYVISKTEAEGCAI